MSKSPTTHCGKFEPIASRRQFLQRAGGGMGALALADLMQHNQLIGAERADTSAARNPLAPKLGHYPAKAKSVIWLFMEGAPSGVDMFDPKPELDKNRRQEDRRSTSSTATPAR